MAKATIDFKIRYLWLFGWGLFHMSREVCPSDRIGINSAKDFVFPWDGTTHLIWIERL